MKAYTYIEKGKFALTDKPKPELKETTDAIVRVTLSSICTSDLHIKHGSVPRAVPGITVGHEMVGVVEQTGSDVRGVKPGDRVTVNVETFCGECFYCKHGYVNNCTPHRRRTDRVCACAAGYARPKPHSRQRYRRAGSVCGRCACHGLLGCTHKRDN